MKKSKLVSSCPKVAYTLLLLLAALILSGNEACREDYDFGSRSALPGTPTPTPDPEEEDDSTATLTPTPTPEVTATATSIVEPVPTVVSAPTVASTVVAVPGATATAEATLTPESAPITLSSVRGALERVAQEASSGVRARMETSEESENWLGEAYQEAPRQDSGWVDSDGDGFSDAIEDEFEGNAVDSNIWPRMNYSSLAKRMDSVDSDRDGLLDARERDYGTDSRSFDSDGDGCADGLEVLSQSDPVDAGVLPIDTDGDCLSDSFEEEQGFSQREIDSDGDGLDDSSEVIYATDPWSFDSDSDGISDSREVALGSDPLVPDILLEE